MSGRRRAALVAAGALSLSSALGGHLAAPAFAADSATLLAGTPCTTAARVCVDLDDQEAWLVKNGAIIRGPIGISSGGRGQETPQGVFSVLNKVKDYKSKESRLPNGDPAPMPWSVFFAPGGIALHSGDPATASAGCVHVPPADAEAFFTELQVGDRIEVTESLGKVHGGFYGVDSESDSDGSESESDESDSDAADDSGSDDSGSDSDGGSSEESDDGGGGDSGDSGDDSGSGDGDDE